MSISIYHSRKCAPGSMDLTIFVTFVFIRITITISEHSWDTWEETACLPFTFVSRHTIMASKVITRAHINTHLLPLSPPLAFLAQHLSCYLAFKRRVCFHCAPARVEKDGPRPPEMSANAHVAAQWQWVAGLWIAKARRELTTQAMICLMWAFKGSTGRLVEADERCFLLSSANLKQISISGACFFFLIKKVGL